MKPNIQEALLFFYLTESQVAHATLEFVKWQRKPWTFYSLLSCSEIARIPTISDL